MKKLILSIAIISPFICHAQISADFGMGATFYNDAKIKKVNYTFNLGAKYNLNNVILRGDLYGVATRNYLQAKMITGGSLGYQIEGFTPAIGYYFLYASSDDKSLNSKSIGYSLEYYKELRGDRGIFGRILHVNEYTLAIVGFRANF